MSIASAPARRRLHGMRLDPREPLYHREFGRDRIAAAVIGKEARPRAPGVPG
ncbi:MAG: hypothetical protein ACYDHM_00490 [Acidiferrobacterales bacterium]